MKAIAREIGTRRWRAYESAPRDEIPRFFSQTMPTSLMIQQHCDPLPLFTRRALPNGRVQPRAVLGGNMKEEISASVSGIAA